VRRDKFIVSQFVKKFQAWDNNQKLVAVFTRAHKWAFSRTRKIKPTVSYTISLFVKYLLLHPERKFFVVLFSFFTQIPEQFIARIHGLFFPFISTHHAKNLVN